jgi:hypothetical protein
VKKHITEKQRYEISALLQAGQSKSSIAKELKVQSSLWYNCALPQVALWGTQLQKYLFRSKYTIFAKIRRIRSSLNEVQTAAKTKR